MSRTRSAVEPRFCRQTRTIGAGNSSDSVKRVAVLILAILMTFGTSIPMVASVPDVGPNVTVATSGWSHNNPMIAFDPFYTSTCVVVYDEFIDYGFQAAWSVSPDNGATWEDGSHLKPAGYTTSGYPVVPSKSGEM